MPRLTQISHQGWRHVQVFISPDGTVSRFAMSDSDYRAHLQIGHANIPPPPGIPRDWAKPGSGWKAGVEGGIPVLSNGLDRPRLGEYVIQPRQYWDSERECVIGLTLDGRKAKLRESKYTLSVDANGRLTVSPDPPGATIRDGELTITDLDRLARER